MAGRPRTRRRRERALQARPIGGRRRPPHGGEGVVSVPLRDEPSAAPPPRTFGDYMEDMIERREWRERSEDHRLDLRARTARRKMREQEIRKLELEASPFGKVPTMTSTAALYTSSLEPDLSPFESVQLDDVEGDEPLAPRWAVPVLLLLGGLGFLAHAREGAA